MRWQPPKQKVLELDSETRRVNLTEAAEYCWKNRKKIQFGAVEDWDSATFQKAWFDRQAEKHWIVGKNRPGWYWFELDLPLAQIAKLERPLGLTAKSCNFGETTRTNSQVFAADLCHKKSNLSVVYNGHEANVLSRIRSHFCVKNEETGALGIRQYSLSHLQWHVSIFLLQHLNDDPTIETQDKEFIARLCNSKTGRTAIEQTWRTIYGWPVLCKG